MAGGAGRHREPPGRGHVYPYHTQEGQPAAPVWAQALPSPTSDEGLWLLLSLLAVEWNRCWVGLGVRKEEAGNAIRYFKAGDEGVGACQLGQEPKGRMQRSQAGIDTDSWEGGGWEGVCVKHAGSHGQQLSLGR